MYSFVAGCGLVVCFALAAERFQVMTSRQLAVPIRLKSWPRSEEGVALGDRSTHGEPYVVEHVFKLQSVRPTDPAQLQC